MNSPIQIIIQHALALEVNRVFQILQNLSWYQEHRYHIDLPKNMSSEKMTHAELSEIIAKEYDEKHYQEKSQFVLENWNKTYAQQFQNLPFEHFLDKVNVVFTLYGTSGSYEPPQEIIINIRAKTADQILKTMIHEMVHLILHSDIEHYKLTHTEKERLVDLTVKKQFFPESNMQVFSMSENLDYIQSAFTQHYPNMQSIFSQTPWKSTRNTDNS